MTKPQTRATQVAMPLANVAASMFRYRASERLLDKAVVKARLKGATWAELGEAAGMSAQGVHSRWAAKCAEAAASSGVEEVQGMLAI